MFQECQHYEDTYFHNMKYDLKGHPRSYNTTYCLWTVFDENFDEC